MKNTLLLIIIPPVVCALLLGAYLLAARTVFSSFLGESAGGDALGRAATEVEPVSLRTIRSSAYEISPTMLAYAAFGLVP